MGRDITDWIESSNLNIMHINKEWRRSVFDKSLDALYYWMCYTSFRSVSILYESMEKFLSDSV